MRREVTGRMCIGNWWVTGRTTRSLGRDKL
jgi:hypothetical protein